MNVKNFVTDVFINESAKFGMKLDLQEIEKLQNIFDFDAVELVINRDIASKTRMGKIMQGRQLSMHKKRLRLLAKKYVGIIYSSYSRTRMISESIALDSQAQLKCDSDIYPCEKKGFKSGY